MGVDPIPDAYLAPIAHLIVDGAAEAIELYTRAFGAVEVARMPGPDGRIMHAQITINNAPIYLCDDYAELYQRPPRHPNALGGSPVTIHQYVADIDATMARAIDAGCTAVMPATDMFWGDRYGIVTDPFGHSWSFATHLKDMTLEEMAAARDEVFGSPEG